MQGDFSKKNRTAIVTEGKCIYEMEYDCRETCYPQSFLDVVKAWKHLVMKESVSPYAVTFEGSGMGGTLVLAACLWCRDHGIPLPSAITLIDPVIAPCEGVATHYFSDADIDDPCAYPLIADYYGFPPVSVGYTEGSPACRQAEQLCARLSEQDIPFDFKVLR